MRTERLRHIAHTERTQITTDVLDAICAAFFGPDTGWWRKEPGRVALDCRDGRPANPFGPVTQAYLTPYTGADRLEDGALVLVHADGRRTIHPYEMCEDAVILLYRFFEEKVQ